MGAISQEKVEQANQVFRKAKIDYLAKEVPRSLDQAGEGLDRVARIVGAMKEFSHPSQGHIEAIDLARAHRVHPDGRTKRVEVRSRCG